MTDRKLTSRITALILTAVMVLSAGSFYAETALAEELPQNENKLYPAQEDADPSGGEQDGEEDVDSVLPEIKIAFVRKAGRDLTVEWTGPKAFPEEVSIVSCRIYKKTADGAEEVRDVPLEESAGRDMLSYTYTGLEYNTVYRIRAEYSIRSTGKDGEQAEEQMDEPAEEQTEETLSSEEISVMSAVEPPVQRTLKSFTIKKPPRLLRKGSKFNLRKYAKEPNYGYAIVQGSCIDNKGEYAYYCLVDKGNYGKLIKVRMADNVCVGVSGKYRFAHGNGMCFDSKRNRVVVASYDNYRKTLTFVDPDNLNNICQKTAVLGKIGTKIKENAAGITALAYNAKYDCYLAMQRKYRNIIIYDAETLCAKAAALTVFDSNHNGVFQSVDADDKYVYFLMSPNGGSQPNNILVAFDWHAEKYEDLLNGNSSEDVWMCGDGSGRKSAVIKITGAREIESLFHTDEGNGRGHFYLTNYYTDPQYRYTVKKVKWKKVKKKVKVKVKWKKVRKKIKWKKVKSKNGKTKWKYKKKKVWKYKYKYKTKKVWKYKKKKIKHFSYYNRDNFVLDLGVF